MYSRRFIEIEFSMQSYTCDFSQTLFLSTEINFSYHIDTVSGWRVNVNRCVTVSVVLNIIFRFLDPLNAQVKSKSSRYSFQKLVRFLSFNGRDSMVNADVMPVQYTLEHWTKLKEDESCRPRSCREPVTTCLVLWIHTCVIHVHGVEQMKEE